MDSGIGRTSSPRFPEPVSRYAFACARFPCPLSTAKCQDSPPCAGICPSLGIGQSSETRLSRRRPSPFRIECNRPSAISSDGLEKGERVFARNLENASKSRADNVLRQESGQERLHHFWSKRLIRKRNHMRQRLVPSIIRIGLVIGERQPAFVIRQPSNRNVIKIDYQRILSTASSCDKTYKPAPSAFNTLSISPSRAVSLPRSSSEM